MTAVVIALLPAAGFGIYNFGPRALAVMAVTIASTVLTELLFGWLWKKKITISDMSAVVTGLLLALNLPVSIPLWMAALGGVFAILVVKMLFGGLGQNFMNPALAARCFLLISFPSQMTNFACDAYTGATPLAALKAGESVNVMNMIVGKTRIMSPDRLPSRDSMYTVRYWDFLPESSVSSDREQRECPMPSF